MVYDPQTKKVSSLVAPYRNQLFKGPNDLDFDAEGNLYFTDPWGTGPGPDSPDKAGAVYQYSTQGILRRIISTDNSPMASPSRRMTVHWRWLTMRPTGCSTTRSRLVQMRLALNVSKIRLTRRSFFATAGSYNPGNGGPDGIHYDVHGDLWASCGIGGIIEYDPRGISSATCRCRTVIPQPPTSPLAARTTSTSTWKVR